MFNAPYYTEGQKQNMQASDYQYPYSDDYMVYDNLKHQYRLTRKCFEERGRNLQLEIQGNSPDKINNFLYLVQLKVYITAYNKSKSTRNQLNYLIAKRGLRTMDMAEYRESFMEMMFLEGCYLLDNGDISKVSGVDLDTMQNMSADVIRNQDRDWDKDAIGMMTMLGLNYAKRYDFYPQGKDINW